MPIRFGPISTVGFPNGVRPMMDVLLVGAALAFFALCFGYVRLCDRL